MVLWLEAIVTAIWHILPCKWLYSWLRRILAGYFPWTKVQQVHSLNWAKEKMQHFKWKREKTDWVQHPAHTDKIMQGDCDDASYWWISVCPSYGFDINGEDSLLPIGTMSVMWGLYGHSIALFMEKSTHRVWIASNNHIAPGDFYWPQQRKLKKATLRAIAKEIAPRPPIFYCLYRKKSLLIVSHFEVTLQSK